MKTSLPIIILLVTVALVGIAWVQSGGLARREMRSAGTPQEAVESLLSDIQARNWDGVYSQLANKNEVDKPALVRELNGGDGSLRTYSNLQNFSIWPVHATADKAVIRARLTWSSAVGQLDEVRDLNVEHTENAWRVAWPKPNMPKVPPQVIPVNYLRWDVIGRTASDDWGVQNVDTPNVRITSMNAVERPDRVVIVGEIVNEDTVPAYVAINATLLKEDGTALDQEGSFDMISHTLLPKQVSPYRIDFPGFHLKQVKSVRMESRWRLKVLVSAEDSSRSCSISDSSSRLRWSSVRARDVRRSAESMRTCSSRSDTGFRMYWSAPPSSAATRESTSSCAESTRTGRVS